MPFNSQITRAGAVIPVEVSSEIIKSVQTSNPLLQMARKLRNMSRSEFSMKVLSALATAYFVNGDTGLKQTTAVSWENKSVHAEELAVIVPIAQSVLDDSDTDIWAEVRPLLIDAFNVAIIQAVLYGINIPAQWAIDLGAAGLVAGALAAGHVVSLANYTDLYEAILTENPAGDDGVFMLVEADGFGVNGGIADLSMKGKLRNTRDANGNPIFKPTMQDATRYELDGTPLAFPSDGTIVAASSLLVEGDWQQLVYSMRQDITLSKSDQGVITDASGNVIYNLFQQDMVALRAVMRLGVALPNPINRVNQNAATRYPFAVLTA